MELWDYAWPGDSEYLSDTSCAQRWPKDIFVFNNDWKSYETHHRNHLKGEEIVHAIELKVDRKKK